MIHCTAFIFFNFLQTLKLFDFLIIGFVKIQAFLLEANLPSSRKIKFWFFFIMSTCFAFIHSEAYFIKLDLYATDSKLVYVKLHFADLNIKLK